MTWEHFEIMVLVLVILGLVGLERKVNKLEDRLDELEEKPDQDYAKDYDDKDEGSSPRTIRCLQNSSVKKDGFHLCGA